MNNNSDKDDRDDDLIVNYKIDNQQNFVNKKTKFNVTKPEIDLNSKVFDSNEKLTIIDSTPNPIYYRNLLSVTGTFKSRPTLEQLQNHERKKKHSNSYRRESDSKKVENTPSVVKFGWIKGVLVRCILNIFGVMIFLRISWVVGQAGIGLASVIVLLASFVTFITALSTSAICTNGEVKGGGAYYLISRSLGPEFGGAIGIVYSFANAVAAAMYVIGFAETLVSIFNDYDIKMIDGQINDTRIIGMITNVILLAIALIGMKWESKVQIFLLFILVLALFNFLIGSFIPGSEIKKSRGFIGYSFQLFKENFNPDFRNNEDFAHVFGVFFPAVTGILAGANISGNLKNPQQAIPKGTLLSIFLTTMVYLVFCWICGFTIAREVTGAYTANITYFKCENQTDCKHGLLHNFHVMEIVSEIPGFIKGNSPIIIAGIFSASLSSALASLVSAPKIFQAVAGDKIFPKISYFAKGHGKDNEPWRGYFLTFFISSFFIAIGELNVIAPIISNFFLMSYALINYSCFDASIAKTPGWRPAFKYYNKWVSLFGAMLCLTVMFIIEWWAALVSFLAVAGFYLYVKQRKPEINWGSSTQAHTYRRSLEYSLKLINTEEHVKNFRPNFLVLTGDVSCRPALIDLIASVTKNTSLMVCSNIKLHQDLNDPENQTEAYKWLRKRNVKSFYTEVNANSLRQGAVSLMQCIGIGKLRPNTLAIGFKNDWQTDSWQNVLDYYQIINDTFQMNFGLCLLRMDGGLDYSNLLNGTIIEDFSGAEENDSDSTTDQEIEIRESLLSEQLIDPKNTNSDQLIEEFISNQNEINFNNSGAESLPKIEEFVNKNVLIDENNNSLGKSLNSSNRKNQVIKLKNTKINKGILQGLNLFHKKYHNGFVDVWWLFDDGGLTILLPYLLMQRSHWNKCKLRIFIQNNQTKSISEEQRNMATLLSKFRIKFHELIVFSTFNKKIDPNNLVIHEKLLENWRLKLNEKLEDFPWKISDIMYNQNIEKTNYHLIMRDMLLQYSQNSDLIIITIGVPSKLTCAALFLSWLDLLTHEMPPVLMVRGNQTPVLTYYS